MVSVDFTFSGLPKTIHALYDELLKKCNAFGEIKTDTTLSCIYFVNKSRFLVIKPQKAGLILEFVLDRREDIFPVIKTIQINKKHVAHRLMLESTEDINDQLIGWIKEAYELKNK